VIFSCNFNKLRNIFVAFLTLAFLFLLVSQFVATEAVPETSSPSDSASLKSKKKITIAILKDGPSRLTDTLIINFKDELSKLMKDEKEIIFKEDGFDAGWDTAMIPSILEKALKDTEVDMIFAAGVLVTQAAADPGLYLNKPVVGGLIQRLEVLDLPISKSGKSQKPNLAFACVNLSVEQDIKAFQEMIGFQQMTLIVDELALKGIDAIQNRIQTIEQSLSIKINVITGRDKADEILSQLNKAQVVVLTAMPRLSPEEHTKLIQGINNKHLPSFSLFGYPDVDKGVLAGLSPDLMQRTSRRSALDFQQILHGFVATDLRVLMPVEAQLLINAKTARLIGYSPNFLVLRTANILHGELLHKGKPLTLEQAMLMAGQNNIDLAISQANVDLTKQESLLNQSNLLPQGQSFIKYNEIDGDTASASLGTIPQRRTTADFEFSQMLFDDALISGYRTSKRNFASSQLKHKAIRYDAMLRGGVRFADLLAALALFHIETENLRLTQNNLSMAHLKFEVGMSGLDEVYRWEAQEARQRGSVFEKWSIVEQKLIALNQTLNLKQETEWKPVDITSENITKYFLRGKLKGVLNNLHQYEAIQNFLVDVAFANSPSLQSFDLETDGQKIALNQRKRKFYLPNLNSQFSYSRELQSSRPGGGAGISQDDNFWNLGLRANLPLFEGGRRIHQVKQTKVNLIRLNEEKNRTAQFIEQDVRSFLAAAVASRENIFFTRKAANKAKLNLNIIQDKYAEGTIGILALLDAQNEYIQREQEAALASYQHLANMINIQRAISWFMIDKTEEEIIKWYQQMKDYLQANIQ